MQFLYEKQISDYSDFSSGRVLINGPKTTAFPIRIASEIMYRCRSYLKKKENLTVYDPCCGGAHLLTSIGYIHGNSISNIYGSDINESIIKIAKANLATLTKIGLDQRKENLERLYSIYQKKSHLTALESLVRLQEQLGAIKPFRKIKAFNWDITKDVPGIRNIDIVIVDIPYGDTVNWESPLEDPLSKMLENIYSTFNKEEAILALISPKKQVVEHQLFNKVKTLKHGKRKITLLKPHFKI